MPTITLNQFHSILAEAYAVSVNDTLYFVGYDDQDSPYVADNDNQDRVDLAEIDGDIEITENGFFFYVADEAIELKILSIVSPLTFLGE